MPMTKEQLEAAAKGALGSYGDLAVVGRINAEGALRAVMSLSKGSGEIAYAVVAMTKRMVEVQMSSIHALLGARNVREFIEAHAGLTRTQIQTALSESAKISELALKLANETIRPVSVKAA